MVELVNIARLAICGALALTASAGVARAQEWTATPEWRIDGDSAQFTRIGAVTVSPQGSLVMTQVRDGVAYLWPARQAGVLRLGRRGEGPGEFRLLPTAGWVGDTLWLGDTERRRATLYLQTGKLVRTQPYPLVLLEHGGPNAPAPATMAVFTQALLPSGDQVVAVIGLRERSGGPAWQAQAKRGKIGMALVSRAGVFKKWIDFVDPDPASCGTSYPRPGGEGHLPIPMCERPLSSNFGPRGQLATVSVPGLQSDSKTTLRVTAVDAAGARLFSKAIPLERQRVTASREERARTALVEMVKSTREAVEVAKAVAIPKLLPLARAVVFGADGTVWLELWQERAPRRWMILGPAGEMRGFVNVPETVSIRAALGTRFWGVETDEYGIESIVRYSITR